MPIQPQVGKDYETTAGNKATVKLRLDKPDKNGVQFLGIVKLNGDDESAGWRNNGSCPANTDFDLDSLWPADDSRQYMVTRLTADGVFRPLCTYYAELGSLKHDNPDAKWALRVERDDSVPPMPVFTRIDLQANEE